MLMWSEGERGGYITLSTAHQRERRVERGAGAGSNFCLGEKAELKQGGGQV
jgi:hypothetical protein